MGFNSAFKGLRYIGVVNTVVMRLHILGPCWCMYVTLFGNRLPDDGVTTPKHVGAVLM